VSAAGIQIRRYREGDREAVWALHNVALHTVGAHLGNGPWDEDLRSILAVYLETGGEFLVGELDGQIVAMGALRRVDANVAELKRMRVHPSEQRRGHGERILLALQRRAHELGITTLTLDTTTGQTAARELYRRHGFRETGREQMGPFGVILMEKLLRA
jgi:ribosomal protein S18 acetylase RimI-like enzyme